MGFFYSMNIKLEPLAMAETHKQWVYSFNDIGKPMRIPLEAVVVSY